MALNELHPFIDSEVARVPQERGVYVLYQVENPIHADGAANLRSGLLRGKEKFPRATHFSMETLGTKAQPTGRRVREVREELRLVRKATFTGLGR